MITLGNDSLLSLLESNQFIMCRVSLSMFLCIFDVYDKAYSLLIADEKSMASLTGILLDVSCSMAGSIGEGTDEEGGPWARSIFEVIDNLIKYDISSDHHVFAIGFGASCGEEVFDIIGTLNGIPNQDNVAERPATTEHINKIFDILEKAGARTIRKWAEDEVVSKALADNLAVVFLKKFKSDKSFLEEFVEKILPPACRDWPEPGLGVQLGGTVVAAALFCPAAAIPTFLALKFGPEMGKYAYSSAVSQYRRATVKDVKEVVEKAKAHLLKKVDVNSIFNVKHASGVVHGCVGEEKLTKKKSLELLERIEPYIYGRTPFLRAIGEAMTLFQDSRFSSHKKLLFILSDGDPTDENISSRIDRVISKFTEAGVTIVSCFITDSTHIDPKRLFSKEQPDWDQFAKFMFSLSSKLSTQSLPRTMFVKRDWTIDFTDNETRLFLQVNHPDHLREGCQVARNVVCSQDALSDMLASVNIDFYINQEVKDCKAKLQEGETCAANAAATVLHLSMTRIRGREGGCPDFCTLRDEIVKQFDVEKYPKGVPTIHVLQKMCPKYRLRCKRVDYKGAMKAVASSRPVVATFRLTEKEWDRFEDFYESNPKGILTKKEIDITARPPETPDFGHAVVLTSFDSECLRLLNSGGDKWGDMGFFRVQKADVLGLQFIDVFWKEDDLKEEEKTYLKKFGSINAGILMELLPSLKDAEYTCPIAECSKRSPVVDFTGTLSQVKCPKCGKEFSTNNAQEGNILALNIYLTSLIR